MNFPAAPCRPSRKVLVLGSGTRSFLSVVRSLGRQGIEVHVAWCPRESIALRSRYVARAHALPAFRPGEEAWKQELLSLLSREAFDLVIPCNDPSLLPLEAYREQIDPLARLAIPHREAFRVAFDKLRSVELAGSLGIPLPRGIVVRAGQGIEEVRDGLRFPVVLKPRSSFVLERLNRRNSVLRVERPDRLEDMLTPLLQEGDVLVQEHFPGVGVGVELLAGDGETLLAFQHERVHEPPRGGGSSYRKSVPLHPALLDAARRLMAALRWTGVAMVEFRQDHRSGGWIFIEINGRFWGSLPLALAAGVDFPYCLYQHLVEGRREFPSEYRVGLHARNLLLDVEWLLASLGGSPAAASWTLLKAAGEAACHLSFRRERSDTFVRDDPAPGWAELAMLRGRVQGNVEERNRRVLASVPGYPALQAARARRALRGARTVLFVCKGNICRSPFAAAYARAVLPGPPRILSAGTYPVAGRPSPREALEAGRALGVDLSDHRSVVLDDEMVRSSDLILVFDRYNAREVVARHPEASRKMHWLGALGGAGTSEVRDPFGRPLADFLAIYRQIALHLDRARSAPEH